MTEEQITLEQMTLIGALSECQKSIGFAQGVLLSTNTQAAQDANDMLEGVAEWLDITVKDLVQKAGEQK